MGNGWIIALVWRLALSALLALSLAAGPAMARSALGTHDCGTHAGPGAAEHAHAVAPAMDGADHAAQGLHADAQHQHERAIPDDISKDLVDAGGLDEYGAAHGDDCCSTYCQSACLSAVEALIRPSPAFKSFRMFADVARVAVVPGQLDRPPSLLLSM
jgi:hypothetical protein